MMPSSPQLITMFLMLVILLVVPILLFGPIAKKAGFPVWLTLLMMIPIFNIVVVWVFAFIQWPAESWPAGKNPAD